MGPGFALCLLWLCQDWELLLSAFLPASLCLPTGFEFS